MKCRECGEPADERYTMNFEDVEPGRFLYWCAVCGIEAKKINALLEEALATRGPEFVEELEAAISEAELVFQ